MDSLSPSSHSVNKIKNRSKTTSFKRPMSCDVNESIKKESKTSFFNFKKGISNSKLNENFEKVDDIKYCLNDKNAIQKNLGRIQGRKFDSDDEEDDLPNEETSVTRMAKLFEDFSNVLCNPALIGHLLEYLEDHNIDYNGLLYYIVVQYYKSTAQLKEFAKDISRFANEIITTFLLDKSNLKIDHKIDTSQILEDLKANKDLASIFDKSSEEVYKFCIQNHINTVNQSIRHGLFTVDIYYATYNLETKMMCLNKCVNHIIQNLDDKINRERNSPILNEMKESKQYIDDIANSVKTSLATILNFYSKKEKDSADTISLSSNKHLRTSLLMRSTESLQGIGNSNLDRYPSFCSKIHKKTQSFFRKGKTVKGHSFQEYIFKYPAECLVCDKILWGINPQGLHCSYCQESIHTHCKDRVTKQCYKEVKKSQGGPTNTINAIENNSSKTGDSPDDSIFVNDKKSSISSVSELKLSETTDDLSDKKTNIPDTDQITEISTSNVIESKATIYITPTDIPSKNSDSQSVDNLSEIAGLKHVNPKKSEVQSKYNSLGIEKSFLSPTRYYQKGHVKNMALKFDPPNISRSKSDDNLARTLPKNLKCGSESVFIQDLVADSNLWANDLDMNIEESFDANKELQFFATHLTREENKAEYTRLLVLMEFHHKIKFTVMTLKRFDYLLIKQWPIDDHSLFRTLSLNCIVPLYELIKTLNTTIELCTNSTSYSKDMSRNVLNWLISNDEANMELWLKYSIDLCCTNSLNLVKNSWKEYISDSKFTQVLTKRHNKMVMVEQLSNMRPLLFNLPLIVSKIHKDLNKFSQFKDETKLWKEIHEKFKKLPTFIDEHCMPLVQLINSGNILNSMDRNSWTARLNSGELYNDYIMDFPRTAFHHKIFDIQEIKISDFKENNKNNKTPVVSVKEMFDAYAICYDNILVILQKENDKYYLKQFKATDTSKIIPLLILQNVHVTKGSKRGPPFELTLIFINVAILAQLIFEKEDIWNRWHDFICLTKSKALKKKVQNDTIENIITKKPSVEVSLSDKSLPDSISKYSDIKDKLNAFSIFHSLFFKEELNFKDFDDMSVLFQKPVNKMEFLIGTSFSAIKILKTCYDNLSHSLNDDVVLSLRLSITSMENRISNFENSLSKDALTTEAIECELSEMQRDEVSNHSISIDAAESLHVELEEDLENGFIFKSIVTSEQDCYNESIDDDLNINNKILEINKSNSDDDDISIFVNEYVRKIIEETEVLFNNMYSDCTYTYNNQNEPALIQVPSIISETSD